MELKGQKLILAPPERLYAALTNPDVLLEAMPGLKKLDELEPGRFAAEMEMGVASIRGRYRGEMQITDPVPPASYRLAMKGQGPGGFVDVEMRVQLAGQGHATSLVYDGVAKVGGKVAGVGQRLLNGVAALILSQFFKGIEHHVVEAKRS